MMTFPIGTKLGKQASEWQNTVIANDAKLGMTGKLGAKQLETEIGLKDDAAD